MTTEIPALEQLFADRLKLLNRTIKRQSEVALVAARGDRLAAAVTAAYHLFDVKLGLLYLVERLLMCDIAG